MSSNLRRFLSYYRPYKFLFALDLVCACLCAVCALIIPIGIRKITGEIITSGRTDAVQAILATGLMLLALIVAQAIFYYVMDYMGHSMGAMMERDMRGQAFRHIQSLSFSFFDNHKTGQLMSRVTNDTLSLAEFYHHGPEDWLVGGVKIIGSMAIIIALNWKLAMVVLLMLIPLACFVMVFNVRMKRVIARNKQHIADVNAQVEESISSIRVVQSFTSEAKEQEKFDNENQRFLVNRRSLYKSEALCYGGAEMIASAIPAVLAVVGGIWILGGSLTVADLLAFLLYAGYLTQPVLKIMWMTEQFQDGYTSFERIKELLDTAPEIKDEPGAVELGAVKGEVRFDGVGFKYQEQQAHVLKGINFVIQPGEQVAIVGESGIGKTTLCALIPRFYDVGEGSVKLDGVDVRDVTVASLRRQVGVVQQDVVLFSGSVMENIRYGSEWASDEQVMQAAKLAGAHEFAMGLPSGYETDIGHKGVKLSGGQRQRISIARAFLKDPRVLIFDEATSALDNESERMVQASLKELSKSRTTLVIAHRLSTIRGADRILVLTEKGIEEQGKHEELILKGGVYAKLYSAQFGG